MLGRRGIEDRFPVFGQAGNGGSDRRIVLPEAVNRQEGDVAQATFVAIFNGVAFAAATSSGCAQ